MPLRLSGPSPSPAISTTTGRRGADSPEHDTRTDRSPTLIFSMPVNGWPPRSTTMAAVTGSVLQERSRWALAAVAERW
ncbi:MULTISPECIES: hypothetical protein [unclassified Streptomyces]|uniref:hypothetical protein n=1 Tax=unclassified Streptomyces TaxID=2593676 RepID=UPI002E301696|nr:MULTISPECIES: hypothetical protein [unclassified Streptomyces]